MKFFAFLVSFIVLLGLAAANELPTQELIEQFTEQTHKYVSARLHHIARNHPLQATREALESSIFAPTVAAQRKRNEIFENATPECIAAGEAAAALFDSNDGDCELGDLDGLENNMTRAETVLNGWCVVETDGSTCPAKARTAIDNLLAECSNIKGRDRRELRKLYNIIGFITNVVCLRDAQQKLCFLEFLQFSKDLSALDTIADERVKLNETAALINADTCDTCMDTLFRKLITFQNDFADPNSAAEVQQVRQQRVANVFYRFLCMRHRNDAAKFCIHELVEMWVYILDAAAAVENKRKREDDFDAADATVLADLIANVQRLACSRSVCLKRFAMLNLAVRQIEQEEERRVAKENAEAEAAVAATKRAVMEEDDGGEFAETILKFSHYCATKEDGQYCLSLWVKEFFKMITDLQAQSCVPASGNFFQNCVEGDTFNAECKAIIVRFPTELGCCLKKAWWEFYEFDRKADTPEAEITEKREEALDIMDALESQCGATVAEPCAEAELTSFYEVYNVKVSAWAAKLREFVTTFEADAATSLGQVVNATTGDVAVKKRQDTIEVTVKTSVQEGSAVCDSLKTGSDVEMSATQKAADLEDMDDPLDDVKATQTSGTCATQTPSDPFTEIRAGKTSSAASLSVSFAAVLVAFIAMLL